MLLAGCSAELSFVQPMDLPAVSVTSV